MTKLITLDFETYYDKAFSLSKITTEQYIRDPLFETIGVGVKIDDKPATYFTDDERHMHEYLHSLDIPNSNLVCHNMAFDGAILAWRYGLKPKYYFDTLSMARPLTGQTVGGSLAALAKKFCLGEKGKEVVNALGKRRLDFGFTDMAAYGEYCKNDVELTYLLFNILREHSTPKEMYIIDMMIRMYTDPVLELDYDGLMKHLQQVIAKKQDLMDKIDSTIGRDALMSNPQFAEVLQKLGVEPPKKVSLRTGKETYAFGKTDVEFKALLDHEDERVQAVVSARLGVKSTLEETRTQAFLGISQKEERYPLCLITMGHTLVAHPVATKLIYKISLGEASSVKVYEHPKATSLWQLIHRKLKRALLHGSPVKPTSLKTLQTGQTYTPSSPQMSMDARLTAKRKRYTPRRVKSTLLTSLRASLERPAFLDSATVWARTSSKRPSRSAKQAYPWIYRLKKLKRLSGSTGVSISKIAALWRSGQEALEAMVKGLEFELGVGIQLRCTPDGIVLPNGMLMRYADLRRGADGLEYTSRYGAVKIYGGKVIENVVQALARIIVFEQMAKIDQYLRTMDTPEKRYKVVLTVHDEVVVVCPEEATEEILDFMIKVMSTPPVWAKDCPISCEGESGLSYGDAK